VGGCRLPSRTRPSANCASQAETSPLSPPDICQVRAEPAPAGQVAWAGRMSFWGVASPGHRNQGLRIRRKGGSGRDSRHCYRNNRKSHPPTKGAALGHSPSRARFSAEAPGILLEEEGRCCLAGRFSAELVAFLARYSVFAARHGQQGHYKARCPSAREGRPDAGPSDPVSASSCFEKEAQNSPLDNRLLAVRTQAPEEGRGVGQDSPAGGRLAADRGEVPSAPVPHSRSEEGA